MMLRLLFTINLALLIARLGFASSHDSSVFNHHCHAVIEIIAQKSYHVVSAKPFSIYSARVVDDLRCDFLKVGELFDLVAPGGVYGKLQTQVNGIEVEIGHKHYAILSPKNNRLGIPILLSAKVIKTEEDSKSTGFSCARVGAFGPSLFWKDRKVVMHPSVPPGSAIRQEDLIDAMQWAAQQWSQSNGSDFQFEIGDSVDQKWIGFDWSLKQENLNIVVIRSGVAEDFYSEWLHESKAIAITSFTFIRQSGEILDADIELNAAHYVFTNCDPDQNCLTFFDLKSILTHEFGHVVGLDHPDPNHWRSKITTMYEESALGETTKRVLSVDDLKGVEFLYPKGAPTRECFGKERLSPSQIKITGPTGCSQKSGFESVSGVLLLLLLFLLRLAFSVYTRPNS